MHTLYIKNMVCHRCRMAVESVLHQVGLWAQRVELGEVYLHEEPTPAQLHLLSHHLQPLGFELIDERRSRIIEKIKTTIIQAVQQPEILEHKNLSELLSEKLHYEYNYLSNLFSETEGQTIEKYFIAQRIEKVKELLMYDELSLSEIAFQLGYSSAAYLSNQFKKHTGLTPGFYKSIRANKRRPLHDL